MKPAEILPVLPAEVARLAESGSEESAGELLREHAERVARSSPRLGRRWAEQLASVRFEDGLLAAYARWSAGVVHHLGGEPGRAESELKSAARAMARAGRPDLADRVRLLLVDVYGEQLRLRRARAVARQLELRFAARGDRERGAVALANLGCAEDAADRVDRAQALWHQAARRLEPGSLRHLLARANLANSAALAGRFAEAMSEHRAVAEAARDLGLPELALQAELNLAEGEFATGLVDAALGRWHAVIAAAQQSESTGIELVAEVDLASAETDLGDLEGAQRRLEHVLPRVREAGLRREEVRVLRLLAVLQAARGLLGGWRRAVAQLAGPRLQLQRDLLMVDLVQLDPSCDPAQVLRAARRLRSAGLTHRGATGLAWAAKRLQERGDRRAAVRHARQALAERGASAWVKMVAHQVLGRAGGAEATRHLFRAVEWADRLHGRLAATADRNAFLRLRGDVYLDLVAALLDRGRPRDRKRALDILSRFRSGWLVDELARRADRGDDPELRRWQELRTRLAALLRQVEGQDEPRVRRFGLTIHSELRSVEEELRSSELALARRRPVLLPEGLGGSVAGALLERLPEGDVFVEYFLDRRELLSFVASRGQLRVVRTAVANEVRELVASVRFHMDTNTWRTADSSQSQASASALRDRLRRLGELLLSPLPAEHSGALWVAPHAELFHIPWTALEGPGGEALIDGALFSLTPGAGVVAGLLKDPPARPASVGLCGVSSDDLPMVRRELRALAGLRTTASVVEMATRQDFLDMLATHDAVHLAGHAVFLDGLPGASGLRLADGYLTVHDLAATRIRASLVSFGVCSGVRMGDRTDHRYEGFLRALLAGGVRTVVGAISPVRDEVACDFDLEFFRRLEAGSDPGAAFRGAVGELRRQDPHPATWGNFHFYGDQRSWRIA